MKNNFTMDEIKNSVEFQWRKSQIRSSLGIWFIIAILTSIIPIIVGVRDFEFLGVSIVTWLCAIGFLGLFFLSSALFYYNKIRYLLKNYQRFNSHEVILDKVSTSYAYRRAIYYTVTVHDEGVSKNVATNPYFSSSFMSKFTCEDFNNKKVVGLYDDERNKFYIVKKVN